MKKTLFAALCLAVPVLALAVAGAGTDDEIRARLAPDGDLCLKGEGCGGAAVATSGAGGGSRDGKAVYDQFCFACHMSGVGGAPVLGDAEAWEPRIAKGMDVLYESTYNGINAMPARGTCMDCTDEELQATVDWMTAQVE